MSSESPALDTTLSRPTGPVIITVCTSCRLAGVEREDAPGRQLLETLLAGPLPEDVTIRPTQCLSVCKRICTLAVSAEGGYTYVFGDLDPAADVEDIFRMAEKVAAAPHGFVPWQERPDAMKRGLIARVPPAGWSPDDGSAPA